MRCSGGLLRDPSASDRRGTRFAPRTLRGPARTARRAGRTPRTGPKFCEVAGLDLIAHLEEQRALPAPAVRHAVIPDERLQRRRREIERCIGRDTAAPRRAAVAVGPPFLSGMKFVDEQGEGASPTLSALRARRTGSARRAAQRSARSGAFRSPRVQFAKSDWSSRSCASGTVDSSRARNSASATSGSSRTAPSRW